jgi:cytochrome c oxidase assembly protein subunit 15
MELVNVGKYKNLHRFSIFMIGLTLLLILVGGHVNSTASGLSVPDWPLTYGENPITYPVSKWVGGIKYEHGHRLLATLEGFLIFVEMLWIWRVERGGKRRWLKNLALIAFISVCIQGVLGGLTVLLRLPTIISVCHAVLAQSLLIITVAIAVGTSKKWLTAPRREVHAPASIRTLLGITFGFTFIQILMGAIVRHTYSGLVIQDFPLAFGKVIPDFVNFNITIHYMHRVGALILTILIYTQGIRVWRAGKELMDLRGPVTALMILVLVQITLGALIIWTQEHVVPNTLHVAVGASVFMTTFIAYIRSLRFYKFAPGQDYTMSAPHTGRLPG